MKVLKKVLCIAVAVIMMFASTEKAEAAFSEVTVATTRYWLPDGTVYDSIYHRVFPGFYQDPNEPKTYVASTLYEYPDESPQTYCTYADVSMDVSNKTMNIKNINFAYSRTGEIPGIESPCWFNLGYGIPGWTYKFSGNSAVGRLMLESDLTIELEKGAVVEGSVCLSGLNPSYPNGVVKLKNCKFTINEKMHYGGGTEFTGEIKGSDIEKICKTNFTYGKFTYYEEKEKDGSSKGTPATAGTSLIDSKGEKLGYDVTGSNTAEFVGTEADKSKSALEIQDTMTDLSGNVYNVTSIKAEAMKNNKNLKSLVIGNNVTSIGNQAFMGCTNLKKITLNGENLNNVGKKAFKKIKKKAKITIKANKKSTAKKALKKINKTGGAKNAVLKFKKNK